MWKPMKELRRGDFPPSARFRKMRLYADEDIEEGAVEYIRDRGVNIQGARELPGHRGKPDSFHAGYAFREKRFLMTRNGKHYLDDVAVPFRAMIGVIVMKPDMGNMGEYVQAVSTLLALVPYGEIYERHKITLSSTEMTMRFIDYRGQMVTTRTKSEQGRLYEWVESA